MTALGNIFTKYDEEGRVEVSNQVFDHEGYDRVLQEHEWTFLQSRGPNHANPSIHYVMSKALTRRPTFRIQIDRTTIRAGGTDVAVLTNIPRGVAVALSVIVGGVETEFNRFSFDGPDIEFPAPAPGLYAVTISRWPFRDWRHVIEATT